MPHHAFLNQIIEYLQPMFSATELQKFSHLFPNMNGFGLPRNILPCHIG